MSELHELDGPPQGWTRCDERCDHDGPFAWETIDGWKLFDDIGVAREMIYEYGCRILAKTHFA